MIGTVTVEAHYSATYVENYLDAVENLPDDVQRHLSRIRELDVLYRSHLRDVNQYYEQWTLNQPHNGTTAAAALNSTASTNGPGPDATPAHPEPSSGPSSSSSSSSSGSTEQSNVLRRAIARIQQSLIAAQELGDEKLQIVQQLQDLIDHKTRQLDQDYLHLGKDFFASIREQSRDESNRLIDGIGSDRYQAAGTGGTAANNGPGQYGAPGNGSGHGGQGNGNGGAGLVGSNPHLLQHTSNGTALGGTAGGHQGVGAGGASGMYSGNNGGGGGLMGNERSSKRARRTRNEQSGAANGAGSNTPNSTCGASPMDIDSSIDSVGGLPGPVVLGGLGGSGEPIGMALSGAGGNGGKQDVASGSLGAGAGSSSGSGHNGSGGNGTMTGGNGSGGASGSGSGGHNSNVSGLSGRDGQGGGNSTAIGSGGGKGAAGSNGGNGQNSTSNNNGGGNGASGSGGATTGGATGSQSSGSNQGGGGGKKGNSGGGGGGSAGGSGGGGGGSGSGTGAATSGKKKKRKAAGSGRGSQAAREAREETPAAEETVDPDEPTYCLCDQISFGEMILCDNDLCPIEWFHFSCVSLISKPKGRWFCPKCRGDRPNVMKPKAQFLKELERYNKEKEEKT